MSIWIRARAKYHRLIERRLRNFFATLIVKKLQNSLLDPPKRVRVRTRMRRVRRTDVSEGFIDIAQKVMRRRGFLNFGFGLALVFALKSRIDFGAGIGRESWITSRLTEVEGK
jgi:hypothetical protein